MDEFKAQQDALQAPGAVGWWADVLPLLDAERAASLDRAASDRRVTHRVISMVLGQWGFGVTPAQVGYWRRNHRGR